MRNPTELTSADHGDALDHAPGNPVTRWMAANVAVAQDPAGNLKPAKDKSTERIDGIVAAHHGHRPRHGRPGGAAARVLHVLCVKGKDAIDTWDTSGRL